MRVVYVTKSEFKKSENKAFVEGCRLTDGTPVKEAFEFDIRHVDVKEILEVELEAMVMDEVAKAYSEIKIPCIVEHAGLIFAPHKSYPGGLTKPMWNSLGGEFLAETGAAGRLATAKAVVAYCDGQQIRTFVGETAGHMADRPRGRTKFYWDTVFIPQGEPGHENKLTYAEIVDDPGLGLAEKMTRFSQSSRAMVKFLEFLRHHKPKLW